jgi:hypothetical protein
MHVVAKINNFPLPLQEEYLLPVLILSTVYHMAEVVGQTDIC